MYVGIFLYLILVLFIIYNTSFITEQGKYNTFLTKEKSITIKSIAAFVILVGHLKMAMDLNLKVIDKIPLWPTVGIFFFLSGFGVYFSSVNKKDYFKHYANRFVKILIPFITAHVVYATLFFIFDISYTIKDIVLSLLGNSTLVRNNWYCVICLVFYALFGMIYSLKTMSIKVKNFLMFLATIVYIAIFSCLIGKPSFWWMNVLPFWGGIIYCQLEEKINNIPIIHKLGICVISFFLFGMVALVGVQKIIGVYPYEVCHNLASLSWVVFIITVFCKVGRSTKLAIFLGNISYEIYLFHGLWIDCLKSKFIFIENNYLYSICVLIGTIAVSIVMNKVNYRIIKLVENRGGYQ